MFIWTILRSEYGSSAWGFCLFCCCFTSYQHLRSDQDRTRIVTVMHTHGNFMVLPHWDTRPQDPWPDPFSWHWANQSLPYPNNAERPASKWQVSILNWLVWLDHSLKSAMFGFPQPPKMGYGRSNHSATPSGMSEDGSNEWAVGEDGREWGWEGMEMATTESGSEWKLYNAGSPIANIQWIDLNHFVADTFSTMH